ncbi:SMP-30/gluconolactonase/LRE family protein [Intrasporangium sp.]|uniref:SMP-30/gluconolactonase/LRE family protein n=1 Tax=Intrasporangium sp. TaxID=1925024 RepID=UPI00293AF59B|nr:SMP-30/gluconolactonase/LRE family protein [Intrasporangium sp.]MDV3220716.1 SMP-30/gluconolactonase/LRE family protein [Intrasporangium sp.]
MQVSTSSPTEVVDTEFVSLDERFRGLDGDFVVERLHTGSRKSEGPVWFPAGRYLVWSDIPNSRLLRWDETTGAVGVFRHDSGHANGNTIDREGRLVTCEQGNRRVTRTEHDGSVTVLADSYRGKPLNSPNDVVVRHDGSIWFTDPPYGITGDYEGNDGPQEQEGQYVFRLDPASGALTVVADDFVRPNGLAFSPDERRLYVADTRQEPSHIRTFHVREDGTLSGGDIYATCDHGRFDGLRVDTEGRIWAAAWDGIHCFAPGGDLIGKLLLPEPVANLTFGGPKGNLLFITAGRSLYSLRVTFNGARYPTAAA